jgi:hypothetical protein
MGAQQGQKGSIHLVDRLGPRRHDHSDVRKQQVTENNGGERCFTRDVTYLASLFSEMDLKFVE